MVDQFVVVNNGFGRARITERVSATVAKATVEIPFLIQIRLMQMIGRLKVAMRQLFLALEAIHLRVPSMKGGCITVALLKHQILCLALK